MEFEQSSMKNEPPVQETYEGAGGKGSGIGYMLAFALALGAFFSGLHFGQGMQAYAQTANILSFWAPQPVLVQSASDRPDLQQFWKIWDILEEKFATTDDTSNIGATERLQGAIDGLVDSYGDPYTVYLPPADSAAFEEDISGEFSGVGMEVGIREGVVTVIAPLPDTPAERAGIAAGDVIVSIDGTTTEDMRIDEAVRLIRGERGTEVALELFRVGEPEFLNINVVRDLIDIPTVRTEQLDGVFIVSLYSFNAVSEQQMRTALEEYLRSGAEKLVIDVRGNPGGFLQSAVTIASFFLPSGKVIVTEEFKDASQNDVFRSRGRQIQLFTPDSLVVLVDGGSASASEILAGALKDHGVATVIGAQTFGKGSVQELVKLDDGSSLKVTVARWLTPNGTSISDGGLTPDIVINRTVQQRLNNEDPQKEAAIRFLNGEEVVSESFTDQLTATTTTPADSGE